MTTKLILVGYSDAGVLSDKRRKPDPKLTGVTKFETCRLHQLHDPLFA